MRPLTLWIIVLAFPWNCAWGQTLTLRPERPAPASSIASPSQPAPTLIPLSVPNRYALEGGPRSGGARTKSRPTSPWKNSRAGVCVRQASGSGWD